MKKFFSFGASGVLAFILFAAQTNLTSCSKEKVTNTIHDTTVVRDTVTITPLTSTQILSKYTWEVYESFQVIQGVASNDTTHYLRGVVNTIGGGVDILRLTFNSNGTGTYFGGDSRNYNTTWAFTTPDEQNLTLVATNGGTVLKYNWSLISITDSSIYQTTAEYPGTLVSARWIPVP